MNTIKIRNANYSEQTLKVNYTARIENLVNNYISDQNCWPDTWIQDDKTLSELEKATFIYHCLNHDNYILK
jgi:hypothetical protein